MTMDMLDEGNTSRTALDIAEELEGLGTTLFTGSNLEMSTLRMSTLKENLDASLDLFADVVLNPAFPEEEFDRRRRPQLAAIARERVQPIGMAMRVFPRPLYGEGHAYGQPLSGSGTEATLNALSLDGLRAFHHTWFRPDNATRVVVGDVTLAGLEPALAARFAGWEPAEAPRKNVDEVDHRAGTVVYLIDRPDSEQSIIFAGHVAPPRGDACNLQIAAMNNVLGGDFTGRINMNLREDKGWSYGAQSQIIDTAGQRPFLVLAPVQTDRTAQSMAEIDREISSIRTGAHGRRVRPRQGPAHPDPARPLGDQRRGHGRHRPDGALRPARRLLGDLRRRGAGPDSGRDPGRGRPRAPARPADLGRGGRPRAHRGEHPRPGSR